MSYDNIKSYKKPGFHPPFRRYISQKTTGVGGQIDSLSPSPAVLGLRTVLPFLSFKGLTHTYLVKTSMTHNKYLTLLFFEENDSISAKSATQRLPLNLA